MTPPSGSSTSTGYTVRWSASGTPYSAVFGVLAAGNVRQDSSNVFSSTATSAPGSGLTWDILDNSTTVATSSAPNGWVVTLKSMTTNTVQVAAPANATVDTNYVYRYKYYNNSGILVTISAPFAVLAADEYIATGTKNFIYPNGSQVNFTVSSTPSSSNPTVVGTVEAGVRLRVEWKYDSTNPFGYYVATYPDGTKMAFSPTARVTGTNWLNYNLTQLANANGNYINFNYTNGPAYGNYWIPTLTSITDSNGSALLSISRSTDGYGRITGISDRYSRSVYYAVETTTGYRNLGQASIVVTTGTSSPTVKDTYGYSIYSGWTHSHYVLTSIASLSPTGSGTATTTINYDSTLGAVANTIDPNGNKRTYTQVSGSQTKVSVANSVGTVATSFTATFDGRLNMTGITDGTNTNTVMSYSYADSNAPDQPSTITDANGHSISSTFDSHGNRVTSTSALGTVTTYTFDYTYFPLGRLTQVQEGSKAATSFAYNEPSGTFQSITSPAPGGGGTVSCSFTYDSLGNLLTETSPGNNATSSIVTTYNYTTDGSYSQAAAIGQPVKVTNNLGKVTHLRYDSQGRPTSAVDALGNEQDTTYNIVGQALTSVSPATGQTGSGHGYSLTTYLWPGGPSSGAQLYDESRSLVRSTSLSYGPAGELLSTTGDTEPVTHVYDAAYRPTSTSDGNGHATTYTYNTAGYVATITAPGGGVDQFTSYDSAGNLLSKTDARGVVTNYVYSGTGGTLSATQFPGSTSLNESYSYDSYGRMTSITDGTGTASATFDDMDHVLTTSRTYSGVPTQTVTYAYYPNGSRQTLTCPAGTWSYSYDGVGRYTSLNSPAGTSTASYADNGWQTGRVLPNGATSGYSYNAAGQITDCLNQTSGGTTLSHFNSFAYDGNLNVTGVTASVPAWTSFSGATTYQYDSKDQLIQESTARFGSFTNGYAYDSAGNPTTIRGSTVTYNSNNQLTVSGFAYDSNGNPTTYNGATCTYDPRNHLTAGGSLMTAGYRSDGLRAWLNESSTTTYYFYDGGTPIYETNGSGTITAINVFAPDGLVARKQGGTWGQYVFDAQGHVTHRLDATGSTLSISAYNANGQETSSTSHSDPFGFNARSGYLTDQVTGLILCGQRYYDPAYARFINRDPIGFSGGINAYGYAGNNPVNALDPSGLEPLWYDRLNNWSNGIFDRFHRSLPGELYDHTRSITKYLAPCSDVIGMAQSLISLPHRIGHLGEAAATQGISGWIQDGGTVVQVVGLAVGGMNVSPAAGQPFAMGLTDQGLAEFAEARGATTWEDFPPDMNWRQGVMEKLTDPNTQVHFNLDGIPNPMSNVQRNASGLGGATDWELAQIHGNPQVWDSLQFWQGGLKVANPFK